jgi:hypothetical protein
VQNFPLDAIAEFHFMTQRFRAEYGRSYGGVLNVVTRSGTNRLAGSAFGYFRDRALNSRTRTEENNDVSKGDYRRWQYGGSVGGPIRRDRTHFFASFERTQQDTTQAVSTQGIAPEKDGVYAVAYRENIVAGNVTHQLDAGRLLSVRYGFDHNVQPYGANPLSPPEAWGENKNTFHSASVGLSSARSNRSNELLAHFSYFHNHIGANSTLPAETFPSGVRLGQNGATPQDTLQRKYQLKDDFTWVVGRHQLKAGASVIDVPSLDTTGSPEAFAVFNHLGDARDSPISRISGNGARSRRAASSGRASRSGSGGSTSRTRGSRFIRSRSTSACATTSSPAWRSTRTATASSRISRKRRGRDGCPESRASRISATT